MRTEAKIGNCKKLSALFFALILFVTSLPFPAPCEVEAAPAAEDRVMVSLGDSFSSGEGIEPFYGEDKSEEEKVTERDWLAHRSEKSWPGQLRLPGVDGQMKDHRGENWYFVASSGATTEHLNGEQKKEYCRVERSLISPALNHYIIGEKNLPAQLKVFNDLGGKKVDYVTITIGGNDMGFTEVVKKAVASSVFSNPSYVTDQIGQTWEKFYATDGIREKIIQAYRNIHAKAPEAKIIVAGYPKLFSEKGNSKLISPEVAKIVNEAVSQFNKEIETIVNSLKAEGIKICFVSVEEDFGDQGAYAGKDACIEKIKIGAQKEELNEYELVSKYSVHPNKNGAEIYRKCVQDKINSIEADGGKSEWPTMTNSEERDIVLVLDASGSMAGTPLDETKKASEKFVSTILKEDASIGVVTYDDSAMCIANFNKNEPYLTNVIKTINDGGGTNIEAGLSKAHQMLQESNAKKKIIVLMSDGEPNEGKVGDSLIEYANTIKEDGIYIYTLGFFNSLSYKQEAQRLMEKIASEGCHYEVDDADNLVFFFEDIANQIQGTKYIYVRIACPVDVEIHHNGEILSSKADNLNQRTAFGTLTFEENDETEEVYDESVDNRIKILRLKEGAEYDIKIDGTAKGKMDYTIGFMDENGEYSDLRKFSNIKITKKTEIDTVAAASDTTILKVDEDGNGSYDHIYKAKENGKGKKVDYSYIQKIWIALVVIDVLLICAIVYLRKKKREADTKTPDFLSKEIPSSVIPSPTDVVKPVTAETVTTEPKMPELPKEKSGLIRGVNLSQPETAEPRQGEGGLIRSTNLSKPETAETVCPVCGQKITNDMLFCTGCGRRFDR